MANDVLFERVALIGIGLIGSSLARLIKRDGLAGHIVANARSKATLDKVVELRIADSVAINVADAVAGADLVIICSPLGTYPAIGAAIRDHLAHGAIVSDVGSVKAMALRELTPVLPSHVHLVPAHPVAGTEHSGPEAGFADLFNGHWCILTPGPDTDAAAVDRVRELWRPDCFAFEGAGQPGDDRPNVDTVKWLLQNITNRSRNGVSLFIIVLVRAITSRK